LNGKEGHPEEGRREGQPYSAQLLSTNQPIHAPRFNLPHLGSPCGIVSVSVGVATVVPHRERDAAVLVGKAEAALGQAKLLGRNRIEADEAVVAAAATAGGWYGAPDNTARKPR